MYSAPATGRASPTWKTLRRGTAVCHTCFCNLKYLVISLFAVFSSCELHEDRSLHSTWRVAALGEAWPGG